ncbi:haloacid dehalogenase family protein [Planococcus sp. PAMC 21323]|uniref:5' nucleotidase, NT5C type n=1 Tax=Planococcus sp. PAMC 21323 TaxID=1526927 RepID=UPI00056F3FE6|nr:HAD family acid phosphatase [Planococcus sp. PAMC 21323]AIY04174.1 haloacid dehalogenase family protein [Planococcus sp. PAMC 21323]
MKFGFDIDDTLINLREYAFHYYQKQFGQQVDSAIFHELNRVEIHEAFGLSDEEGKDMWNRSLDFLYFTECPLYSGALELLKQLESDGHEIFYITSRPIAYTEDTFSWMVKQGFPIIRENFFCGMKDSEKVDIIKDLQLDYYFDDKPAVLNTLVHEPVNVIVKDQSYNRHLELPRVKNWDELGDLMNSEIK